MRVKILLRFVDFTRLYLYHCHNLEHEDMGMIRNYLVQTYIAMVLLFGENS